MDRRVPCAQKFAVSLAPDADRYDTDTVAERALNHIGFRGTPPYSFQLTQGQAKPPAYWLDATAEQGGIAGTCRIETKEPILFEVPLRIHGLNPRTAAAVWRSDAQRLDYFACSRGGGYVTFNADITVDFYAGNVARCDSNLFVFVVIWNESEAWFRIQNPIRREITFGVRNGSGHPRLQTRQNADHRPGRRHRRSQSVERPSGPPTAAKTQRPPEKTHVPPEKSYGKICQKWP